MTRAPKTLVLVSGGPDSAVLLAWALRRGPVATLEIDYEGRPRGERAAARRLLDHFRIRERYRATLPRGRRSPVNGRDGYIPLRNLAFHANALLAARLAGAGRVAAGHLRPDADTFRDAARPFFDELEGLANRYRQAREGALLILTPFAAREKVDVWRTGERWGVPLEATWSCHRDGARPCGRCSGCRERAAARDGGPIRGTRAVALRGGPARRPRRRGPAP